ncbi:MAG: 1-acyl-sn-glycerol-3-phosphate acyltransferase [Defluviitaleaceae bacterium]|nr:1-acyl-sn-glycerol-3-phosphate acyltransferase [Defluviitaleaceae bacterium]
MRNFWLYIYAIFWLLGTVPALLSLPRKKKVLSQQEYYAVSYGVGRRFGLAMLKFTGSSVSVSGLEKIPAGPVLFVSNHPSFFDIAVFLGHIPKMAGFIAKYEISKIPILKRWMLEYGCVFMDRSDIKKSAKAINDGIELLRSGHSQIIFPEGTRSQGREVLDFKAGSFKLATKAKVPIVPITIDGTYKIYETGGGRVHATDVQVYIHDPIDTVGLTNEEAVALPGVVRDLICSKL